MRAVLALARVGEKLQRRPPRCTRLGLAVMRCLPTQLVHSPNPAEVKKGSVCQVPGCDRSLHKLRDYYKASGGRLLLVLLAAPPHLLVILIWAPEPRAPRA